jgi:hypothetical protein
MVINQNSGGPAAADADKARQLITKIEQVTASQQP